MKLKFNTTLTELMNAIIVIVQSIFGDIPDTLAENDVTQEDIKEFIAGLDKTNTFISSNMRTYMSGTIEIKGKDIFLEYTARAVGLVTSESTTKSTFNLDDLKQYFVDCKRLADDVDDSGDLDEMLEDIPEILMDKVYWMKKLIMFRKLLKVETIG